MDTKKSAARAAKDVRTPATRGVDRSQILSKRSSVPPADVPPSSKRPSIPVADVATAKKPGRNSSLPPQTRASSVPPQMAENDNAKKPTPIARGRLPTGSLHTEARVPADSEGIKQRLTALVNVQQKLSELKRSSHKHFYEIGELLHRIRDERLFEVKGYGSFEAFLEREVNLGTQFCLQSVRIFETFLPAAVQHHGFNRLATALETLESGAAPQQANGEVARTARSPIPPHKL